MKVTKVEPGHLKKRTTDYPVYFNDYMGVTLSAADSDVSIVHLKGFLNYILNLPSLYDPSTQVLDDSLFQPRGYTFNNECAMDGSHDYCIRYAEANGGVTEYPPPAETDKNGKNKDQKDQSKDQKQNWSIIDSNIFHFHFLTIIFFINFSNVSFSNNRNLLINLETVIYILSRLWVEQPIH